LLEGLAQPKQIAERIKELKLSGCALTDNSLAGAVQFQKALQAVDKKAIFGLSLDVYDSREDNEIVIDNMLLLARNHDGWTVLVKLISESNDGRVSSKHLANFACHDLIAISNPTTQEDGVYFYKEIFSYYYLELNQNTDITLTRRIAEYTNTQCVATSDVHYATPDQAVDHHVLLATKHRSSIEETANKDQYKKFFECSDYCILSANLMEKIYLPEELERTLEIAALCEEYQITRKPILPQFDCPNGYTSEEYLRKLCIDGWNKLVKDKVDKSLLDEYGKRVKNELDIFSEAKLSDYFLIVRDIIHEATDKGILVGPGRGSVGGCMVAYLLGITDVDPVKYNLVSSRFYNRGRNTKDHIALPDIDIDFPVSARDNIIQYIKDKYGHDKVAQVLTFTTMKGRGALKDILRANKACSFDEMNKVTEHIPDEAAISDQLELMDDPSIIRWSLENHADYLRPWCYIEDDEIKGDYAEYFKQAIRLEGTKRAQSRHAAAVLVSSDPLNTIVPMRYDKSIKEMVCGMNHTDCEAMGIIKIDCLGLNLLDKISNVLEMIECVDSSDT
jgi:DNA polymerase-3 subunit alpha